LNRRPIHFRTAVSLAIAVAAAILWLRNAGGGDAAVLFLAEGHVSGVLSSKGQLMLVLTNASLDDRRDWTVVTARLPDDQVEDLRLQLLDETRSGFRRRSPMGWHWEMAGFSLAAKNRDSFDLPGVWHRVIGVPYWLLVALPLVSPALALFRRRLRRRRAARGLCVNCGYNVRHSASDRCPECGSAIPISPANTAQIG
jgi:hypothetical protein